MTRAGSSIARSTLFYAALAAIGLCAYGPALNGGLLWDDEAHLIPPALASWSGLARLWTDFTQSQQYYPVASTAFWAMNRLWGHEPLGYHVANVLLHALSALLIARLAARWSLPGGLLAAVVFLLHPVHVESVAWISELKNTLSTAFCLLAALAYVDFDATRRRDRYAAALAFFALALGSKSVTAVLPAALLVVAWWRRGRISWRDAAPLLPFFALGIAAGLATAWLEYAHVGAQGDAFALGAVEHHLCQTIRTQQQPVARLHNHLLNIRLSLPLHTHTSRQTLQDRFLHHLLLGNLVQLQQHIPYCMVFGQLLKMTLPP
jgi:hypothetical protein